MHLFKRWMYACCLYAADAAAEWSHKLGCDNRGAQHRIRLAHIYTIDPILCRPRAQHTHTPFTKSKQQQGKEEGQIRHYSRPDSDDSDPYSALSLQKIV